jgi:hypothetical protein
MNQLRWLAYETYTCNQNDSDEDDVKKVCDEESDSSASFPRIVRNVYHKKNFHDENSLDSAKSKDEEGLIKRRKNQQVRKES